MGSRSAPRASPAACAIETADFPRGQAAGGSALPPAAGCLLRVYAARAGHSRALHSARHADPRPPHAMTRPQATADAGHASLLLIEDHRDIAESIVDFLEPRG